MRYRTFVTTAGLLVVGLSVCHAASGIEKFRNAKVVVIEETLAPGESEALPEKFSSMVVYMTDGLVEMTPDQGKPHKDGVKEGQTVYQSARAGMIKNAGTSPLHFTRIEFLTAGSPQTLGMKGLSPNYVMLLENRYARAYDIKIPAYNVSKSAVNAWTVQLAHELKDTAIKVNAVHPGSVKTDMNSAGDLDVADGARTSVRMALLDADGPTGGFVHFEETLPW